MNLNFKETKIGRAENDEGAVVEPMDRELMSYRREKFSVPVETYFLDRKAIIYQPTLPAPLPADMTAEEVYAEIRAGISAANGMIEVIWKTVK